MLQPLFRRSSCKNTFSLQGACSLCGWAVLFIYLLWKSGWIAFPHWKQWWCLWLWLGSLSLLNGCIRESSCVSSVCLSVIWNTVTMNGHELESRCLNFISKNLYLTGNLVRDSMNKCWRNSCEWKRRVWDCKMRCWIPWNAVCVSERRGGGTHSHRSPRLVVMSTCT